MARTSGEFRILLTGTMMTALFPLTLVFAMAIFVSGVTEAQEWKMQPLQIQTRWAVSVDPANALPEYPRPQLVRRHW
jgi:hypothetical protein